MVKVLAAGLVTLAVLAGSATASRDPLTGVWVAHDVAGDGSTDRFIVGGPASDGTRSFTLHDSYGTFCETDGPGTGAVLLGFGTARLDGSTVHTSFESFVCGNGRHGSLDPPLTGSAVLTEEGLDNGYYVAVRVGG